MCRGAGGDVRRDCGEVILIRSVCVCVCDREELTYSLLW